MKNISNNFILIYEDDSLSNSNVNEKNFVHYNLLSTINNHLDAAPHIIDNNTEKEVDNLSLISGEKPKKVKVGNALGKNEISLNSIEIDDISKYSNKLKQIKEIIEDDNYDKISIVNNILYKIYRNIVTNMDSNGVFFTPNVNHNIKHLVAPFVIFGLNTSIKKELEKELNEINTKLAKIGIYHTFILNSNSIEFYTKRLGRLFHEEYDEFIFKKTTEELRKIFREEEDEISNYKNILDYMLEELKNEFDNHDYNDKDIVNNQLKNVEEIKLSNILLTSNNKQNKKFDFLLDFISKHDIQNDKEELNNLEKIEKSKINLYIINKLKILYLNQSDKLNQMTENFDMLRHGIEKSNTFEEVLNVIEENIERFITKGNNLKIKVPKNIKNFHKISVNI